MKQNLRFGLVFGRWQRFFLQTKDEKNIIFCFKKYFLGQNMLKIQIELWVALIEISHRVTYIK